MADNDLIQCGDHSWAPWSIVCTHVLNRTAAKVYALPKLPPGESEFDYVCMSCAEEVEQDGDAINIDNLRPVCMHCVTRVLAPYEKLGLVDRPEDD